MKWCKTARDQAIALAQRGWTDKAIAEQSGHMRPNN